MDDIDKIECRIRELEKELGTMPLPALSRDEYVEMMLRHSDADAKLNNIDMEWRRSNKAQMWLDCLEELKREKDNDTRLWRKMQSWD